MVVNILVMIHGMIPNLNTKSHFNEYNDFFKALRKKRPSLAQLFESGFTHPYGEENLGQEENLNFIGVEWGHEPPNSEQLPSEQLRKDERLTRAQNFIIDRVSYDKLVKLPDSDTNNITMSLFGDFPNWTPVVRNLIFSLRQSIVIPGLGDVVYYCSSEGERQVRSEVYGQVLKQLDKYLPEKKVRIHLIGQSLGVTLTHDFLYGLFHPEPNNNRNPNQEYRPDFANDEEIDQIIRDKFMEWRKKAQNGELELGSLTSTASQLPIFVMRKQELVDLLAKEKTLRAANIGIRTNNQVKWKIFYDVDDLLGFATRRLYNSGDAIMDIQVDSADNPGLAHTNYWINKTVIEQTADLLVKNAHS